MEEALMDALLAAGDRLAAAMRAALRGHGLPEDVSIVVDGERVVVASRSAAVRRAEMGEAGRPPAALLEAAAREAAPQVVRAVARRLGGLHE